VQGCPVCGCGFAAEYVVVDDVWGVSVDDVTDRDVLVVFEVAEAAEEVVVAEEEVAAEEDDDNLFEVIGIQSSPVEH
jgi:hypothetical protein